MSRAGEAERPAIEVRHPRSVAPEVLRQVCAGIEEEGVPHRVVPSDSEPDALAAAVRGAQASMLDVGIGIDDGGAIAVAQASFPSDRAVLRSDRPSAHIARQLGHNTARIVTRLPLEL